MHLYEIVSDRLIHRFTAGLLVRVGNLVQNIGLQLTFNFLNDFFFFWLTLFRSFLPLLGLLVQNFIFVILLFFQSLVQGNNLVHNGSTLNAELLIPGLLRLFTNDTAATPVELND